MNSGYTPSLLLSQFQLVVSFLQSYFLKYLVDNADFFLFEISFIRNRNICVNGIASIIIFRLTSEREAGTLFSMGRFVWDLPWKENWAFISPLLFWGRLKISVLVSSPDMHVFVGRCSSFVRTRYAIEPEVKKKQSLLTWLYYVVRSTQTKINK